MTSTTYTLSCSAIGACQFSQSSLANSHRSEPKCYPLAWHNRSSAACRGDDRRRHGLAGRAAPCPSPDTTRAGAPLTSVDWRGVVLANAKKSEPDVRFSCAKISIIARCQALVTCALVKEEPRRTTARTPHAEHEAGRGRHARPSLRESGRACGGAGSDRRPDTAIP